MSYQEEDLQTLAKIIFETSCEGKSPTIFYQTLNTLIQNGFSLDYKSDYFGCTFSKSLFSFDPSGFYAFTGEKRTRCGYTRSFQGNINGKYVSSGNSYISNITKDKYGDNIPWTLITLCAACGQVDFVKMLIKLGADPKIIDSAGNDTRSVLEILIKRDENPNWKVIYDYLSNL